MDYMDWAYIGVQQNSRAKFWDVFRVLEQNLVQHGFRSIPTTYLNPQKRCLAQIFLHLHNGITLTPVEIENERKKERIATK